MKTAFGVILVSLIH